MSDKQSEWENTELTLKAFEAKRKALNREIGLIIKVDHVQTEFFATFIQPALDRKPITIATWAKMRNIVHQQVLSEREIGRLQRIADAWTALHSSRER